MSKVLKLAREFNGMSQLQVAQALGVAKSSISEFESGKRALSLQTIRRYAKVFGIPASSLLMFMEEIEGEYVPAEHGRLQSNAIKVFNWIRERTGENSDQDGPSESPEE